LSRYPAFIVAETFVDRDMDAATGQGFRAIAESILGNNVAEAQRPTGVPRKFR
jgi:hypothetical protein